MRVAIFVGILILVGIAVLGFYRGWFSVATDNTDQRPSATITVDQNKIKEDGNMAKEGVQSFGQTTPEATDDPVE